MDKNVILDLYYGKISPMDAGIEEQSVYEEHSRKFLTEIEKFAQKLTTELKEEFIRLCEDEMKSEEVLHRDGFCKGFQLGLRMAVEALYDKN